MLCFSALARPNLVLFAFAVLWLLSSVRAERPARKNFSETTYIIIIIIKGIYIAQVRKGHKCAMSAEMAVWLLCPVRTVVGGPA